MSNQKTFSIGLTMAGAVSAGAYTAGVLDYLIKTLSSWEKAKAEGEPDVPNDYNVNIEIMSGASAGGITAALAALSLRQNHKPFDKNNLDSEHNLLYDCWVNMADDGGANNSIEKLLELDDLKEGEPIESLLNSKVIDLIAQKAVDYGPPKSDFPSFICDDMDVIMTVTNINGLDYNIDFKSYQGGTPSRLTMHSGFYRFRFDDKEDPTSDCYFNLDLNKKDHRQLITKAAKTTGAFPIGLKARKEKFDTKFIRQYSDSIFPESYLGNVHPETSVITQPYYHFIAVDGGMINNEPYGYAYKNIKEKFECRPGPEHTDYAIIMVDPFPSTLKLKDEDRTDTGLFSIIPKLIGTLRNQVMFKQEDLLNALSDDDSTRFLIAPIRKVNRESQTHPIACGALSGFSGFFDKQFRQHDFELGRKNCQDFIRYYFAKREDENHPIHENWTPEMKERFKFYRRDKAGRNIAFLPIIPDVDVNNAIQHDYKVEREKPMEFPEFDTRRFEKLNEMVRERAKKMVRIITQDSLTNGFGKGLFMKSVFFMYKKMGPKIISKRIARKVEEIVRKEFEEFGLIKEEDKKK